MDKNDIKPILMDMFMNKTEEEINNIMALVYSSEPQSSVDLQLESMINYLSESGDSTVEEGAVGINRGFTTRHMEKLQQMFPTICPNYLREVCSRYQNNFSLESVIDEISAADYPTIGKDPLDIWDQLREMLPNADPAYLKNQARVLVKRPEHELSEFIQKAIEKSDYPTLQDYFIRKQKENELNEIVNGFSIDEFLKKYPEPFKHFQNPERKHAINGDETDIDFARHFLHNHFTYLRQRDINKILNDYNNDLIKTFERLKKQPKAFLQPRPMIQKACKESQNAELLEEIAFLKNQHNIKYSIKMKEDNYRKAAAEADLYGLWQSCNICFDDKLLPEECYSCNNNCMFCKECLKNGIEMEIGKGNIEFRCFADCGSSFSLQIVKMVLEKKTFECLMGKIQAEEIRRANIDGLETCPFCDYSMIPSKNDKIFKCKNIGCMKESCRMCRHESHIPLRCNEVEYDEDVRLRTYIENKMTEALVRQCWNCHKSIIKETGCNKMTCTCGAKMCYVCGAKIDSYTHFGTGRCPLHTDNLDQFHLNRVIQGANRAKHDLGVDINPEKLKIDPTKNLTAGM